VCDCDGACACMCFCMLVRVFSCLFRAISMGVGLLGWSGLHIQCCCDADFHCTLLVFTSSLHSFITFQLTDRNMFNVYHKFIKFYHGSLDCLLTPNTSAELHQGDRLVASATATNKFLKLQSND
jgi:hypothetical protein